MMDETGPATGPQFADRPAMPAGYGIQPPTREHGLLPWEFASSRLESAHNYWLVTASPDGAPHAAPLWGLWHSGAFYFSTDPGSRKGRNMTSSGLALVHLESGDDVVVFEGIVEEMTDRPTLVRLARAYAQKYPGYEPSAEPDPNSPFYVLRPRKAYAWREKDFPTSATRWRLG